MSVSARTEKRATPTRLPSASSEKRRLAGSGVIFSVDDEQPLVMPLARREHHPMLAERYRLAVAVGGDVADAVDRHFRSGRARPPPPQVRRRRRSRLPQWPVDGKYSRPNRSTILAEQEGAGRGLRITPSQTPALPNSCNSACRSAGGRRGRRGQDGCRSGRSGSRCAPSHSERSTISRTCSGSKG